MAAKTSNRTSKAHKNLNETDTRLLWVAAGGRCEICRELLTESKLSYHQVNLAERAHIVGQGGKSSPRHDAKLSDSLATSRDNIMLLCFNCHQEIDAAETKHKWPVERLKKYKEVHEERIKYLTSLDAKRTRVLVFQTAIQQSREGEDSIQQSVSLRRDDLHDAILPDYFPDAKDPSRIRIDLPTEETSDHWNQLKTVTKKKWDKLDHEDLEHLSVFCLGKIPAVVYFGRLVGNTRGVRIMNVQQGVPTRWKSHNLVPKDFEYQVRRPEKEKCGKKDVLLIISLSGKVELNQYSTVTPSNAAVYRIDNKTGNFHPDWLIVEEQVKKFQTTYQHLMSEIQEIHGQDSIVHLLIAAPTPIVFEIGRLYRPNQNPVLNIYNCVNKRFEFAFTLGVK